MRLFLFFLSIVSTIAVAGSKQHGKVRVGGEIIESACTIATEDVWQEVDFGNVFLSGSSGRNKNVERDFQIRLVHCSPERGNGNKWVSASVTFDGAVENADDTIFTMKGPGDSVGFRIIDSNDDSAHSGKPLMPVMLLNDKKDLDFKVRLVTRNGDMSAGKTTSFVRFIVDYQ
ncbi:type 1 fimbrial protein [Enterobacteriaceae bacterium 4M9]|nr:type 1 fimbrial protein [Enterobacteriaceae bacterium 4M9]